MKKNIVPIILLLLLAGSYKADAQFRVLVGPGFGYRNYGSPYHQRRRQQQSQKNLPPFHPSFNVQFGYGFPNLDKNELPTFYNYYQSNFSQMGPITGAFDYRFSRSVGIGLMVTHGTVNVPYYDYNNTGVPSFTGALDNWSVMLNLVNYLPVNYNNDNIVPYLRFALGVNIWNQTYTDNSGNSLNNVPNSLSDLAYQFGLGAKFKLTNNTGLFVEAGYGKYILQGGLSFKF